MERSKSSNIDCIISELYYGIAAKWYKYLPLAFISFFFCMIFYGRVRFISSIWDMDIRPSTLDYLLNIFNGMKIYVPSLSNPFEIPIIWLIPNIYVALTIFSYPTKDLSGFGKHLLLQSRNRSKWYLNKCVWVLFNVVVCYIMICLPPLLISAFTGSLFLASAGGDVMAEVLLSDYGLADPSALAASVFILPILTSLALSSIQLFLEFTWRPIFSFTGIVVLIIASAYFHTPFLIGNISMFLRSKFAIENGVTPQSGVLINLAVILICGVAGALHFRKYDILEKD